MSTAVSSFVTGSISTTDQGGTSNWVNATLAQLNSNNSLYATSSIPAFGQTDLLRATGYTLSVPTNAALYALYGMVDRKASLNNTLRGLTYILNVPSNGQGMLLADSAGIITTSDSTKQLGGSSSFSQWSFTPTVADANSASTYIECDFVNDDTSVARTISVDYFQLNAVYDVVSQVVGGRMRGSRRGRAFDVVLRCVARSRILVGPSLALRESGLVVVQNDLRVVGLRPADPERPPLERLEVARCLPHALALAHS